VLVVCAVAASSATAATFTASGVPVGSTVTIAPNLPITQAFVLAATGIAKISCSKATAEGATATNGSSKAKITDLKFTACVDESEPTKCIVSTIETKPIKVTLEDTVGGKTVENFQPESGTEFTKIILKNKGAETCESTANLTVRGLVVTNPENNTTLSTRHPLSANIAEASNLLIYAAKSASFVGAGELLLVSGGLFCLLS
jgi:hypothetical protein